MVSLPVNQNAQSDIAHYNPRKTRLFVANLNKAITVRDVRNKFSKYGKVIDVRKPKNSVACVDYETKVMATGAMTTAKNCIIRGIKVELTRKMPTFGATTEKKKKSVQTAQPIIKQTPNQLASVPTGAGGNSLMRSGRVGRQVGLGNRVGFGPGRVGGTPRQNLQGAAATASFTRGFPGGFTSPFEQASLGGFMNGNSDSFSRNLSLLRETLQMANASLIKTPQQNALDAMNKDLVSRLSLAQMLKQSTDAMPQPLIQMQQLQGGPMISRPGMNPMQRISRPGMNPMQRQNNVKAAIRNRLDLPLHKRLGGVQKRLGVPTLRARMQLQK